MWRSVHSSRPSPSRWRSSGPPPQHSFISRPGRTITHTKREHNCESGRISPATHRPLGVRVVVDQDERGDDVHGQAGQRDEVGRQPERAAADQPVPPALHVRVEDAVALAAVRVLVEVLQLRRRQQPVAAEQHGAGGRVERAESASDGSAESSSDRQTARRLAGAGTQRRRWCCVTIVGEAKLMLLKKNNEFIGLWRLIRFGRN